MCLAGESYHALLLTHRDPESRDYSLGVGLTSAYPVCCPLIPAFKLQTQISNWLPTDLWALKRGRSWVAAWQKAEPLRS